MGPGGEPDLQVPDASGELACPPPGFTQLQTEDEHRNGGQKLGECRDADHESQ